MKMPEPKSSQFNWGKAPSPSAQQSINPSVQKGTEANGEIIYECCHWNQYVEIITYKIQVRIILLIQLTQTIELGYKIFIVIGYNIFLYTLKTPKNHSKYIILFITFVVKDRLNRNVVKQITFLLESPKQSFYFLLHLVLSESFDFSHFIRKVA